MSNDDNASANFWSVGGGRCAAATALFRALPRAVGAPWWRMRLTPAAGRSTRPTWMQDANRDQPDPGRLSARPAAAVLSVAALQLRPKAHRLHRHHLASRCGTPTGKVSLYRGALRRRSSVSLAAQLLGHLTSPSHAGSARAAARACRRRSTRWTRSIGRCWRCAILKCSATARFAQSWASRNRRRAPLCPRLERLREILVPVSIPQPPVESKSWTHRPPIAIPSRNWRKSRRAISAWQPASLNEYIERFPQWAEKIRALFPAMLGW